MTDPIAGDQTRSFGDLEDFFEHGAVGLHIVAADGTIVRANRAELSMLGYSAEEYVGRHIAEFHVDQDVIADVLVRLGRGERLDRLPARLRAKDGSIRHVQITSSAQFQDGKFIQTRCFTFDVSEARAAEEMARNSEQRFQAMLQSLPTAIYTTDAEGKITFFNRAAVDLAGREPVLGEDSWCVSWRLFHSDGSPLPLDVCPMAIALKERRPIRDVELIAERPDGSRARLVPHPTPVFDSEGRLTGAINMLVDITERHAAEQESARLAAIVLSSQDAIIGTTCEGQVTFWSKGAANLYGYEAGEILGRSILQIVPAELHDEELQVLARVRGGERIEQYETERVTKDGQRVNISLAVSLVTDRSGAVVGIAKVGRDITERKQAERLQNLLMGELNHRVKNTLATVQAIAHQTLKRTQDPVQFAENFSGRLRALAQAHSLLTDNSWEGADLSALIRDQLSFGRVEDDRIACTGPAVALEAQAALHLALVLHELGTNARKYGSLSVPDGKLSIDWSVRSEGAARQLVIRWVERDGPPVIAPARHGFGTTLIQKSLQGHSGFFHVNFEASGVSCELGLQLGDGIRARRGAYRVPSPDLQMQQNGNESSIRNKRVLIVEDEPLVAMDLAATLEDEGCNVVGHAATLERAMDLIHASKLDAALLDANLGGQSSGALAAALTQLNVPFAFISGYGRESLPEAFRQAPLIEKPYARSRLVEVLMQLVERSTAAVPLRRISSD